MAGRGDILAWGLENAALSYFSAAPHTVPASELFGKAFGSAPVSSSDNMHPQLGRLGNAVSRPVANFVQSVQLQPGRFDIAIAPSGDELGVGGYPAKKDDVITALNELAAASKRLIGDLRQVNRVALNVRFSRHSETVEEANREIAKIVPVNMDLGSQRDFVLQSNWRGSEAGVGMNRIVKWSSEPVQVISGPFGDFGQPSLLREFWAAIVHFDFNTLVPRPIFTNEELSTAVDALVEAVSKARKSNLRFN